jgi:hypothetical protein
VAQPARQAGRRLREAPPLDDPDARARAYRQARLRRYARDERERQQRFASIRFWIVLAALLAASLFLVLAVWHQVEQLFGL